MAITTDILRTWRGPRDVIGEKLAQGVREDRALAMVMGACLLILVAQLPGLARQAHLDPAVPFDARLGGALLALLFFVPLILYGLAGASQAILRLIGGRPSGYATRVALFWSLLATSPLMLAQGLVQGLVGPGAGTLLMGLIVLAGFLYLWGNALAEAGFPRTSTRVQSE